MPTIYLTGKSGEYHELSVIIDDEHFYWAMQWRWHAVSCKQGFGRKVKWYARRNSTIGGRAYSVFLHKEICLRQHGLPPSLRYIMVDHINGDSLDCRADNLRWATPSMNRQNYNGAFSRYLLLDHGHKPKYVTQAQEKRNGRANSEKGIDLGSTAAARKRTIISDSMGGEDCPF